VLVLVEEGRGLGTLLVIILLTQKLGSIVKCLNNAVKDAARHFVVASPSLTAPFKRRAIANETRLFQRVKGLNRSVP
jgi:hypothetical protein